MRLLGQWQTESPVTKCRSSCKFGFQVSLGLGLLRRAVWHHISNNDMPEQSLSHSFMHPVLNSWRTGCFPPNHGREQTRCWPGCALQSSPGVCYLHYCPVPIWTSLSTNVILSCTEEGGSSSFSLYPIAISLTCAWARSLMKKDVTNTSLVRHPLMDKWWHKYTKVHLNSSSEVMLQQRTWALALSWGW